VIFQARGGGGVWVGRDCVGCFFNRLVVDVSVGFSVLGRVSGWHSPLPPASNDVSILRPSRPSM